MGVGMDMLDMAGINGGVALGGGKTGMTKKGLNGPEITAACQKMGGKGMTQGMGGGGLIEAEIMAQLFHQPLDGSRIERGAST